MSSPSSQFSSRSDLQSSPASPVLTPSRKVKALLAQFEDSESDSNNDSGQLGKTHSLQKSPERAEAEQQTSRTSSPLQPSRSGEEEGDDLPFLARGRVGRRLQKTEPSLAKEIPAPDQDGGAYERIQMQLHRSKQQHSMAEDRTNGATSSEEERGRPVARRRLMKRKNSPLDNSDQDQHQLRSVSPMFFPSPSAVRLDSPGTEALSQGDKGPSPISSKTAPNSKFLALVEKHRKQRLEREAAEIAKRAARSDKVMSHEKTLQRGSSPADGSSEDSDNSEGSFKKLTQQSRPARKASKKALEEMSRETQRMSRNMLLAHQARTRKKITKESLLARFNFPVPSSKAESDSKVVPKSSTPSSTGGSESEASREHVTPSTSPIHEASPQKTVSVEMRGPAESLNTWTMASAENPADVKEILSTKALDVLGVKDVPVGRVSDKIKHSTRPFRVKWTKADAEAHLSDSNSDLEIVTSRAKTRKYAVFETLPKRKAKETESHIALRSLAHLNGDDHKQQTSMNAIAMEYSLRKAAREQARREREEKIAELRSKGVVIQTAEERAQDQQEVEDLVEKARQEAAEIKRREKELAKKDGTFVKDQLDDDESDDDGSDLDYDNEDEQEEISGSEESEGSGTDGADEEPRDNIHPNEGDRLLDDQAEDQPSGHESERDVSGAQSDTDGDINLHGSEALLKRSRTARIISDDEDDELQEELSAAPVPVKTPQSAPRSAKKVIPGLAVSDELPLGLTQAFAATMADSQTQDADLLSQVDDGLEMTRDLPSPNIPFAPKLHRLESIDIVSDSQPASQTQPLNVNLSFPGAYADSNSPTVGLGISGTPFTQSQIVFEPTQDVGFMMSPFAGNRFASETPSQRAPQSTVETVIVSNSGDQSPILQRRARLVRGRAAVSDGETNAREGNVSAFDVMHNAAKEQKRELEFDRSKSAAKEIIDEAAEESDDEYAGLGGASDDDAGEENEEDRKMIDEDTQIGEGDEQILAGIFADRERKQDEAAVSKLLKDITTGALRRKRGVGDELDLSDEEDAKARIREAKRREFAKMRRELLKDEAVGKIAEDRKKEAFLRSIEDREDEGDEDDFDQLETPLDDSQSQSQSQILDTKQSNPDTEHLPSEPVAGQKRKRALEASSDSDLNRPPPNLRRGIVSNKRPTTLAEIRESVSFLIEEPDSQAATIDLGLSDSEDEPEAYVDLDRHFRDAEVDENAAEDDGEDLGDFIVDDENNNDMASMLKEGDPFKKPLLPATKRAPFNERRTRGNVVNRLELLRQASSSSASTTGSTNTRNGARMAFLSRTTSSDSSSSSSTSSLSKLPSLLRRATTNSSFSFGSMSGRHEVSATGVVTVSHHRHQSGGGIRTERGSVEDEKKEFIRKAAGGRRNAVNYRAVKPAEERMSSRAGVVKKMSKKKGMSGGFLGALFRTDSWE